MSKDALESRCKCKIERDNPILPWLISHTVANINRFQVGTDGKTAHERLRGRKFRRYIAEFSEKVLYLKADSAGKDKFSSRWETGFFFGIKEESGEVIIGTEEGVIKTRSFKRRGSDEERWSYEGLEKMKGSPWEPIPGREDTELKTPVHIDTGHGRV